MTDKRQAVSRRGFMQRGMLATAGAMGVAAGLKPIETVFAANPDDADTSKIVNYNPQMEYRRCGKTDWMISAVCMGGHWKRINNIVPGSPALRGWTVRDVNHEGFAKNRYDVVTRAIERGINYIDACAFGEIMAYSNALRGRRDKMHLGWSHFENEARYKEWLTTDQLLKSLDEGMRKCKQEYIDLWRITCVASTPKGELPHTEGEEQEIVGALEKAKKAGKVRATGISSHHRPWLASMIEKYPEQIEAVVTPYTAKTKVLPKDSIFDLARKHDCGIFGIKPFASNSIFKGDARPGNENEDHDNRLARLTLRSILCNPAITAPIPGLITQAQVDNAAVAVAERRHLNKAEQTELDRETDRAFANLPAEYQWLKDWEYV